MNRRLLTSAAAQLLLLLPSFFLSGTAKAQNAEATYKMKCLACHAADGSGNTPAGKAVGAHDFLSADVQKETDAELTDIITNGKNKMPPYGKTLKPQEIKALAAYVRQLGQKK